MRKLSGGNLSKAPAAPPPPPVHHILSATYNQDGNVFLSFDAPVFGLGDNAMFIVNDANGDHISIANDASGAASMTLIFVDLTLLPATWSCDPAAFDFGDGGTVDPTSGVVGS